jgi:hypothetical protein
MEGSGYCAYLSMAAPLGEPEGGWLLYWRSCRICKARLQKRASLSIGAPLVNLEGGSGNGVSLWELCKGNLEGKFLYWGP